MFLAEVERPNPTRRAAAMCHTLLERHGVLTREAVNAEGLHGGFAAVYPVLRAMEDAGRIRRGYFVAGLTAAQFAVPGADDLLRSRAASVDTAAVWPPPEAPAAEVVLLAATDPANPYGAAIDWPAPSRVEEDSATSGRRLQRSVGAHVVLYDGELAAYLSRGDRHLQTFLPDDPVAARERLLAIATALRTLAGARHPLVLESIDGQSASRHLATARFLERSFERSGDHLRVFAESAAS